MQSMDQIETVSTQLVKQESSVNKDMFKKYLMVRKKWTYFSLPIAYNTAAVIMGE